MPAHPNSVPLVTGLCRCGRSSRPTCASSSAADSRAVTLSTGRFSASVRKLVISKGGFRTLYFSLAPETAVAEVLAHHRSQAVPDAQATPLVLVAARVDVQRLLDLTGPGVRRQLGLSVTQLTAPWRADQHPGREALTQAVGRLAREHGFQGLFAPSAVVSRSRNLVLFPDRMGSAGVVAIHDEKFPWSGAGCVEDKS